MTLVSCVEASFALFINKELKILKTEVATSEVTNIKVEILCQKFEIDRMEQYSRKENVRIYGIPERDGQNTDEIVLNKGVQLRKKDISVRQRLPIERDPGKPRGIIANIS